MYASGDVQYALRRDGTTVFTSRNKAEVLWHAVGTLDAVAAKRTATPEGWTDWEPVEEDSEED